MTKDLGHNDHISMPSSKEGAAVNADDQTPVDPTPFPIQPNLLIENRIQLPLKTEEIDERIKFRLTNEKLWENFHKHTTEMIVTKAGR